MLRSPLAQSIALVALCLIAASCSGTESTQPYTPESAARRAGVPPGWFGGSSTAPPSYSVGVDNTNKKSGSASAYITALSSQPVTGFGVIGQSIRADNYRGKRVRWSGWVAYKGLYGGMGNERDRDRFWVSLGRLRRSERGRAEAGGRELEYSFDEFAAAAHVVRPRLGGDCAVLRESGEGAGESRVRERGGALE